MGMKFNPITGFLDLTGGTSGGGTITGVIPTNSIDFQVSGPSITGDVILSAMSADSNNKIIDLSIETDGIRGQILNSDIKTAALDLQGPATLLDNNLGTVFSYSAASYKFTFIRYSIERNGNYKCGTVLITNDATTPAIADNGFVELGSTGVTFLAAISAGNVQLQYSTTTTGFNASMKYSITQWS